MYEYLITSSQLNAYQASAPLNKPDGRAWRMRESKIVETTRTKCKPSFQVPMPGSYSTPVTETEAASYQIVAVWELYKEENEY